MNRESPGNSRGESNRILKKEKVDAQYFTPFREKMLEVLVEAETLGLPSLPTTTLTDLLAATKEAGMPMTKLQKAALNLRNAAVYANRGVAYHIARQQRSHVVDQEDLVSAGMTGLILAADRYDPTRPTNFFQYACLQCKHQMQMLKSQNGDGYVAAKRTGVPRIFVSTEESRGLRAGEASQARSAVTATVGERLVDESPNAEEILVEMIGSFGLSQELAVAIENLPPIERDFVRVSLLGETETSDMMARRIKAGKEARKHLEASTLEHLRLAMPDPG